MTSSLEDEDRESFGRTVRARRLALGLSQEALAAAAFGNPDRKSQVSAIENARLARITPNTARRLGAALELEPGDLPAGLRWPAADAPAPTEARLRALEAAQAEAAPLDDRAVAGALNRQMTRVLARPMVEIYRARLADGLARLQVWTGRPFGLQSLLLCYALSLLYVIAAGLVNFGLGDVAVGAVRLFRDTSGDGPGARMPGLASLLLGLGVIGCWALMRPLGVRALPLRVVAARLVALSLLAGAACGVTDYLGVATVAVAALFAVPSIAAVATQPPVLAALFGAGGGTLFGLMAAVSSGLRDDGLAAFAASLSEGVIIGGLLGGCAGLTASLIARRIDHLRAGQLAGAGGGAALGAVVALAGLVAAGSSGAISGATLGLFSVAWLALPLANAVLDYLSLGVSQALAHHVLRARRQGAAIALAALVDCLLAVLMMALTVALVGLALQVLSWHLGVVTMSGVFLAQSAADPWGQGLWLTLMALSTVSWTWLHFAGVIAPLLAGRLVRALLEQPVGQRLSAPQSAAQVDLSAAALIGMRGAVFYGQAALIAALPLVLLWAVPGIMAAVLRAGIWLSAGVLGPM